MPFWKVPPGIKGSEIHFQSQSVNPGQLAEKLQSNCLCHDMNISYTRSNPIFHDYVENEQLCAKDEVVRTWERSLRGCAKLSIIAI